MANAKISSTYLMVPTVAISKIIQQLPKSHTHLPDFTLQDSCMQEEPILTRLNGN